MAKDTRPIIKAIKASRPRKKKPLSKEDAQTLINKLARLDQNVFIPEGEHAEQRGELREFTRNEIIEILRDGSVEDEPVYEDGRWRYKVKLPGFRRRPFGAAVVTIIRKQKEKDLLVVTVMWLHRR